MLEDMDSRRPVRRRPVFLDLRVIRLPVNALVSILHRVAGVFLVLGLPVWATWFVRSLEGEAGYLAVHAALASPGGALFAGATLAALAHHGFAGLRHLLLDAHWGLGREASRRSAWAVLVADVLALPLIWGMLP